MMTDYGTMTHCLTAHRVKCCSARDIQRKKALPMSAVSDLHGCLLQQPVQKPACLLCFCAFAVRRICCALCLRLNSCCLRVVQDVQVACRVRTAEMAIASCETLHLCLMTHADAANLEGNQVSSCKCAWRGRGSVGRCTDHGRPVPRCSHP